MKFLKNIYYVVIPLLIIGIPFKFTSFPIALLALLPLLFFTKRHTVGIFFLMYGGPLGGVIRAMYPSLPVYGVLLVFIGFLLIWDIVLEMFRSNRPAFFWMLFIMAFFGLFYLIGPKDDFATQKYFNICLHGIMMLFGYFAFDRSKNIDAESLTKILVLASICMYAYVISANSMTPGSLFDYNWFREQVKIEFVRNGGVLNTVVGYQQIGMLVLFATVIFLSKIEITKWKSAFYVLCTSELTLMSGCRQAILGVLLAIILRFVLFRKDNASKGKIGSVFIWIIVAFFVLLVAVRLIFTNIESSVMTSTLEEGDAGRQLLMLQALQIFKDNPLFGAGIGGYHSISGMVYPHNFVMELLAETGLFGTIVSLLILVIPFFRKGFGLYRITNSNMFYYLIVLGIFVRVLVSSDLTESIELFSAVLAITASKKQLMS